MGEFKVTISNELADAIEFLRIKKGFDDYDFMYLNRHGVPPIPASESNPRGGIPQEYQDVIAGTHPPVLAAAIYGSYEREKTFKQDLQDLLTLVDPLNLRSAQTIKDDAFSYKNMMYRVLTLLERHDESYEGITDKLFGEGRRGFYEE